MLIEQQRESRRPLSSCARPAVQVEFRVERAILSKEAIMAEKKKPAKKKKSTQQKKKRQRNAPLHIPLPFEQIVDAMLQTPSLKKKEA
jgi:hypothetical protein